MKSINRSILLISIHALLAESDYTQMRGGRTFRHFYPRSPCGERQHFTGAKSHDPDFYPRSPCGERPHGALGLQAHQGYFYPRSPCGERHYYYNSRSEQAYFYPRSPCGERRWDFVGRWKRYFISIHALLAESDHNTDLHGCHRPDFYPRSPCGERQTLHRGQKS